MTSPARTWRAAISSLCVLRFFRLHIYFGLVGLFSVAAVGCGLGTSSNGSKVTADKPSTVALVLVDVSKSTYGTGGIERKRYAAAFAQIVESLPGGTLLKGDIIDVNPLSDSSLPISEFYENYGGVLSNQNQFQVKQQHKKAERDAERAFAALLTERPTGDSILDSLSIAQNVFQAFPSAKVRYLIIFSDMIETSPIYRFTSKTLRPAVVSEFITRRKRSGNLPDLSGVQVYVVGAGATRGQDTKLITPTKHFWLTYLAAAHASLPEDRYSSALIRFP